MIDLVIKNESVAFVGNAKTLIGTGLGAEIDSFDFVIRTNIYPIPEERQKDYGSKCDILSVLHREQYFKNITNFIADGGRMFFIYDKNTPIPKNICYIQHFDEDTRQARRHLILKVLKEDPNYLTAGHEAMFFCLESGVKRFKFFGIDGYQSSKGVLAESYSNYLYNNLIPKPADNKFHNFAVLNKYVTFLLQNGIIEIDEYSKKYFL